MLIADKKIKKVKKYRITYSGYVYNTNGKYLGYIDDLEEVEKMRKAKEKTLIKYVENKFKVNV